MRQVRRREPDERHVQRSVDDAGLEASPKELWDLFDTAYLTPPSPDVELHTWTAASAGRGTDSLEVELSVRGQRGSHEAQGTGPVDALCRILADQDLPVDVLSLHQQSLAEGNTAAAITYLEHRTPGGTAWAAGLGTSTTDANLAAVVAAVNHRHD